MQSEGNSTIPTVLIVGSNILNIILDPIFIFNLDLGLKGAAYATVLSSLLALIVMLYWYLSGRTKVPLSIKNFKFRSYIFFEIFKVAFPNFAGDMVWCMSMSFINSILTMTMGPIGLMLFSVSNKLENLFIAPARGFARALLSVTGHLFGACKFEELEDMFKYVLKVALTVSFVVMIVFIFLRNYIFGLFSITGMENEVTLIAGFGMFVLLSYSFTMISAKMLDGFGKSMYSLVFSIVFVVLEMGLIYLMFVFSFDHCVLIGITAVEVFSAVVYYVFMRHLFGKFKNEYDEKSTIKNFNGGDESSQGLDDKIDGFVEDEIVKHPSRVPLIFAVIAMGFIVLEIISIPIRMQNYVLLASGIFAVILTAFNIYLMYGFKKPIWAIIGFIAIAVIILVFMGHHGYVAGSLLIIAGLLLLYIRVIVKLLKKWRLLDS